MTTTRRSAPRVVLAAFVLGLVAVACGDKSEVGSGVNTDITGVINDLNSTTTKAAGAAGSTSSVQVNDINATTTVPKVVTTTATTVKATTTTRDTSFPVGINGDSSGKQQFDPNTIAVRVGGLVKFTNNDTKVRSVKSTDGGFRSPDLQPGQSWIYKATKPSSGAAGGVFHIEDGTRSYATATLQVS